MSVARHAPPIAAGQTALGANILPFSLFGGLLHHLQLAVHNGHQRFRRLSHLPRLVFQHQPPDGLSPELRLVGQLCNGRIIQHSRSSLFVGVQIHHMFHIIQLAKPHQQIPADIVVHFDGHD